MKFHFRIEDVFSITKQFNQWQWCAISCVMFLITGMIYLHYLTPWQVGVGYDSYEYIGAAEGLVNGYGLAWSDGLGYRKPLIQYPPLYPIVLAFFHWIFQDTIRGASLLNILLYGLNISCVGGIVFYLTRQTLIAILGMFITLVSPFVLDLHLMAMSEPLYFFWMLLTLLFLAIHLHTPSKRILLLASLTSVCANLTRYIGISLVLTGALVLIIHWRISWQERLKNLMIYISISLLPMLLWMIRNSWISGSIANRGFNIHWVTIKNWNFARNTVIGWFIDPTIPNAFHMPLLAIYTAGLIAILVFSLRKMLLCVKGSIQPDRGLYFIVILTVYSIIFCILLWTSLSFFDASSRLNNRILSPLYFASILIFLVFLGYWHPSDLKFSIIVWLFASLALLVLLNYYCQQSVFLGNKSRATGQGFNSRTWIDSETLQALRQLGPFDLIITTEPFPVHFHTGFPCVSVPEIFNPVKSIRTSSKILKLHAMRERLKQPNTILVIFNRSLNRPEIPTLEELTESMTLVARYSDGAIYAIR